MSPTSQFFFLFAVAVRNTPLNSYALPATILAQVDSTKAEVERLKDKRAQSGVREIWGGKGTGRVGGIVVLNLLCACATAHYTPLAGAEKDQVEQLKENLYRVEYQVSSFTSQEQLDGYLRRRCAELTLREGYDYFHLSQRADVLALSRRTSITVTMFKAPKPVVAADLYDAKEVLAQSAAILKND